MKPSIIVLGLLSFVACIFTTSTAQSYAWQPSEVEYAATAVSSLKWESKSLDAGKVALGEELTLSYYFENEGSVPVKIVKVKPSCGCTGVDYPKGDIAPGERAYVKAFFKVKNKGHFNKTVIVYTEAGGEPTILSFKGEGIDEPRE